MDFRVLLAKYKSGQASDEETKLIESELEKYEAIKEYLFCEDKGSFFKKGLTEEKDSRDKLFIKKGKNKKIRKIALSSVLSLILVLFTIFYVVSPIMNSIYYNPTLKSVGGVHEDLFFDLKVLTELNLPGYALNGGVLPEKLGFGSYKISFFRRNLFTNKIKYINANIKKSSSFGYFEELFPLNYMWFFGFAEQKSTYPLSKEATKEQISYLKDLSPVSYISAYITFEKDLTLKEFDELKYKYNKKISFSWVGIRTQNTERQLDYLSGFNPNFDDAVNSGDSADKDKYPYLQLVDWMQDSDHRSGQDMPEAYIKHFTSLLTYMKDREKAVKALDVSDYKSEYYKNALDYIKTNGINSYGVLIYGEARQLIELINSENIRDVHINDVLPSKYRSII